MHIRFSKWAAASAVALAVIQSGSSLSFIANENYVGAVLAGMGVLGLLSAIKLWFHNCFESRLIVILLASLTLISHFLDLTIGLPGAVPGHLTIGAIEQSGLSLAVVTLVMLSGTPPVRPAGSELYSTRWGT